VRLRPAACYTLLETAWTDDRAWRCLEFAGPPADTFRVGSKKQTPDRGRERRRTPRVQAVGQLVGEPLSFDSPVTVLDLSTGGFSIETMVPLSLGDTHEFRFSLGDRVSVIMLARIVHQRVAPRRPAGTHIVGLEFLDTSDEAKAGRAILVQRILAGQKKLAAPRA